MSGKQKYIWAKYTRPMDPMGYEEGFWLKHITLVLFAHIQVLKTNSKTTCRSNWSIREYSPNGHPTFNDRNPYNSFFIPLLGWWVSPLLYGWWLNQPIWNTSSSNWEYFPFGIGGESSKKCVRNHQLDKGSGQMSIIPKPELRGFWGDLPY